MKYKIYTDGAHFPAAKVATYGFVVLDEKDKITYKDRTIVKDPEKLKFGQVYSELQAVLDGLDYVTSMHDFTKNPTMDIDIYFDYEGIRSWAYDGWKANNVVTQNYKEKIQRLLSDKRLKIRFYKTSAHSGINKVVHDFIQIKEFLPGVFEIGKTLIINAVTEDQDIYKFFKKLEKKNNAGIHEIKESDRVNDRFQDSSVDTIFQP